MKGKQRGRRGKEEGREEAEVVLKIHDLVHVLAVEELEEDMQGWMCN